MIPISRPSTPPVADDLAVLAADDDDRLLHVDAMLGGELL
jgi:hypothetical protein